MERLVSLLPFLALVLVTLSTAQGWNAPDFCHDLDCPEYRKVVQESTDFEEREYVASQWITTKMAGVKEQDLLDGYYRLKDYCTSQKDAGHEILEATWPALVTIIQGEDGSIAEASASWFVPPNLLPPNDTDPTVTWEVRPAATVYVRIFSGVPTNSLAMENAKQLREALVHAGKSFEPHRYAGAAYENPMNFFIPHHNEIWIYGP